MVKATITRSCCINREFDPSSPFFQISEKCVKKTKEKKNEVGDLADGVENAGFQTDLEKGDADSAHGHVNGDLMAKSKEEAYYEASSETETVLVEKDESDNEEKGKKEEKWKENYVPYEDSSKESDKE
jgi:hypothetical protein